MTGCGAKRVPTAQVWKKERSRGTRGVATEQKKNKNNTKIKKNGSI
jgi:hypothetical protein